MITALVTGIGGTRSIAVMNALHAGKQPVRVIGTDANYFNAGAFACDTSYLMPFASEPDYLPRLKKIIKDENVSIIFGTVEKEVSALAKFKEEIEKETGARVIVPEHEILDICFDKYKTQQYLEQQGAVHIPTIYSGKRAEIKTFAKKYGLPLVRKPVSGHGSQGLSIIRTAKELATAELDSAYVLQKYIENEDTEKFYNTELNEYTAEVFVNDDFSIAGGIVIKRALHAGETVAGYRVDDDKTLEYLNGIAKALRIKGPCNFQYRKNRKNVYVFEINPLYSGTTFIRANYGFNSVEMAVESFVNKKHPRIETSSLKDEYFIRYLQEAFIEPKDMETFKSTRKFTK
jgi:carbamoyl-phosphate synthase large subunit